jgi:hypothetical protein
MEQTAEIEWEPIKVGAFEEAGEKVALWTAKVESESELAQELLLDPLPLLSERIEQVESNWTVSLERVNAHKGGGPRKGPRKIIVMWTVVPDDSHVHGMVYRLPET